MSLTIDSYSTMTATQRKGVLKDDLIKLLDNQIGQPAMLPADTLRNIITDTIEKSIAEKIPTEFIKSLEEMKTEYTTEIASVRADVHNITEENTKLKKVINEQQKFMEECDSIKENLYISGIPNSLTNGHGTYVKEDAVIVHSVDDEWQTVKGKTQCDVSLNTFGIPLDNRFEGMPIDNDCVISADQHSTDYTEVNTHKKTPVNKNRIYVNSHPEHNKLNSITSKNKQIPGKKTKTVIISDSITKRIDMKEFNHLANGDVVKRAFPGATASQLNCYIKASLNDDKPNSVIICAGTNNLTKKDQTVQDTAKEIVEIVKTCRNAGVSKVFISSLICRPAYHYEINEINKLLEFHANTYNYIFINNSNIRDDHLWKDGVHLNDSGICILANNYLYHTNNILRRPLPFASIWDL